MRIDPRCCGVMKCAIAQMATTDLKWMLVLNAQDGGDGGELVGVHSAVPAAADMAGPPAGVHCASKHVHASVEHSLMRASLLACM
jgi:hypothetical protein